MEARAILVYSLASDDEFLRSCDMALPMAWFWDRDNVRLSMVTPLTLSLPLVRRSKASLSPSVSLGF